MIKRNFITLFVVFTAVLFSSSLVAKETEDLTSYEKPSQDVKLVVDCGPGQHMCNCHKEGSSPEVSNIDISPDSMCNLITHNFHYCEYEGNDCDCAKIN